MRQPLSIVVLASTVLAAARTKVEPKGNTVNIEIFGESLCPDTTRFWKNHLMPAYDRFLPSARLNITYHPFGVKTGCTIKSDGDFDCHCQHGSRECEGNRLQSCVIAAIRDPVVYVPIVGCIQGVADIDRSTEKCLRGNVEKITDVESIITCAQGRDGHALFARHGDELNDCAPDLYWVPWVMINGKRDKSAEYDLARTICTKYMESPKPTTCANF